MLATLVDKPFDKPGWVYEEKYDGLRFLAYKEEDRVQLLSRNEIDRTLRFPEIANAIRNLRPTTVLLDGEIVAFDRKKVSGFQFLQQGRGEAVYAVFDCLFLDGQDLRLQPLSSRRAALESVLMPAPDFRKGSGSARARANSDRAQPKSITVKNSKGVLILSRRLAENGIEAYRVAQQRGFEGLVAKDITSVYVEARSKSWLKVKVHQEDEFIIAGYTKPEGARQHFSALLLGAYKDGKMHYAGKVGTGFDHQSLSILYKKFQSLVRQQTTLIDPPRERDVTYLAPKLVAQISFQEWTADQKLRQPVFLGLRDDKEPEEVLLPESAS